MPRPTAIPIALAAALLLFATLANTSPTGAAPAAQSTGTWSGTYFANANLEGNPAVTRDDANIDFAWGNAAPATALPASNFSVRWTRWVLFDSPGTWTLTTINNDGIRLYVDDNLVIDSWTDQAVTAHTVTVNLTQAFHLIRVEYYDRSGSSLVRLQMISANFPDWRGEYYGNANLQGTPAFVRNDSTLNFTFGSAGPGGGVPGAGFSVRWTRSQYLDAGRYRFTTLSDDGARLWVDNQLLVDQWHDQVPTNWSGEIALTTGNHLIRMEYFNHLGTGLAILTWTPLAGATPVWRGDYYDNTGLSGSPDLTRDHADLNFDWGTKPPGTGIASASNWSARFTSKRTTGLAGYYTITCTADDGVRVSVDNNVVIDQWHDSAPTTYAAMIYLNPGTHDWRVDYYQRQGSASLHVAIAEGVAAPPPAGAAVTAFAEVVVDDKAAGAFKSEPASNWHDYPAGYGNHAFWLQNGTFSQASSNWARWYPDLPRPGRYDVQIYVPGNLATTRNARYWILHDGQTESRAVNQSLYTNQWVSIGAYDFDASGGEYVSLSDATFEPPASTVVVVDAVKFVPR